MTELFYSKEEVQQARQSLLKFYSNKCVTHGAYILTTFIVIFTFLQAFPRIQVSIEWRRWISSSMLGFFTALAFLMASRSLYWSKLESIVLWVKPASDEDFLLSKKSLDIVEITILKRLAKACEDNVKKYKKPLFWLSSWEFLFVYFVPLFFLFFLTQWLLNFSV